MKFSVLFDKKKILNKMYRSSLKRGYAFCIPQKMEKLTFEMSV